jgi:hypothetical protein
MYLAMEWVITTTRIPPLITTLYLELHTLFRLYDFVDMLSKNMLEASLQEPCVRDCVKVVLFNIEMFEFTRLQKYKYVQCTISRVWLKVLNS